MPPCIMIHVFGDWRQLMNDVVQISTWCNCTHSDCSGLISQFPCPMMLGHGFRPTWPLVDRQNDIYSAQRRPHGACFSTLSRTRLMLESITAHGSRLTHQSVYNYKRLGNFLPDILLIPRVSPAFTHAWVPSKTLQVPKRTEIHCNLCNLSPLQFESVPYTRLIKGKTSASCVSLLFASVVLADAYARPEWMTFSVPPVPPPPVRPSIAVDGGTMRSEDDLMYKVGDIIKASVNVRRCETEGAPARHYRIWAITGGMIDRSVWVQIRQFLSGGSTYIAHVGRILWRSNSMTWQVEEELL